MAEKEDCIRVDLARPYADHAAAIQAKIIKALDTRWRQRFGEVPFVVKETQTQDGYYTIEYWGAV